MTILDQIRENWPLILAAANVGFGWLMWRFSRVFASKKSVEELATAHGKSAEAIQMLQTEQRVIAERLANLPTTRDLADLRATTAALGEAVPRLDKSVAALANQVHLLTQNEFEGARK
jgi:hypothetical protein